MRLAVIGDAPAPTTREVADAVGVPYTHAAKVVTRLQHLGVVEARRGRGGGLALTTAGRTGPARPRTGGRRRRRRLRGRPALPAALRLPSARSAAHRAGGVLRRPRPVHRRGTGRPAHRPAADRAGSRPAGTPALTPGPH